MGELRLHCLHILDQFQAVLVGKGNIHQGEVRRVFAHISERLLPAFRFTARHEIGFVVDQLRQSLAHHGMIINNEDCSL